MLGSFGMLLEQRVLHIGYEQDGSDGMLFPSTPSSMQGCCLLGWLFFQPVRKEYI